MVAVVGESPTIHFTITSDPALSRGAQHSIRRDDGSEVLSDRVSTRTNMICFHGVKHSDAGKYVISSSNPAGEGWATFRLKVNSKFDTSYM